MTMKKDVAYLRFSAGAAGIASAIAFLAEHHWKGVIFASCSLVMVIWSGVRESRQKRTNKCVVKE